MKDASLVHRAPVSSRGILREHREECTSENFGTTAKHKDPTLTSDTTHISKQQQRKHHHHSFFVFPVVVAVVVFSLLFLIVRAVLSSSILPTTVDFAFARAEESKRACFVAQRKIVDRRRCRGLSYSYIYSRILQHASFSPLCDSQERNLQRFDNVRTKRHD